MGGGLRIRDGTRLIIKQGSVHLVTIKRIKSCVFLSPASHDASCRGPRVEGNYCACLFIVGRGFFGNWKIKQMTRDLYIFPSYRIVLSDEDIVGLMLFRKYDGSVFLIPHLWLFFPWLPPAYHSIYQKDACFILTRQNKTSASINTTFLCCWLALQHDAEILMLPFHSISIFAEIHFHLLWIKKL